jgi:hypothetical protein
VSEANLWEWLRDVALPLGQYSRIETGDTSPGFPDVHCQLGPGLSPTIELKFSRSPSAFTPFTASTGMRKSQIKWIRENVRQGGVSWIIAEVTPSIFIIGGHLVDQINGASQEKLHSLAEEIIHKDDPERAARVLHRLLMEED